MTSSNHSSTEPTDSTGADDHFVESVFDAGGDQADVGDLVDHAAPPDPGPDGAAADPDGFDDESEDLDVVADELARAAKMLAEHPNDDPSLLADLDLAAAVGPESEPALAPEAAPAPEPVAPLLTDHERPAHDLAAELAKRAGVDLEAARTTVEVPGPFTIDPPGSDQPPVPPAPPEPAAVQPPASPAPAPAPAAVPPPVPAPAPPPVDAGPPGVPIDQVAVRKLGGFNFLSVAQWAGLPRDERARLLKGGLVQFLYEGDEVPAREALQWLQRLARADANDPDDPPRRGSRR